MALKLIQYFHKLTEYSVLGIPWGAPPNAGRNVSDKSQKKYEIRKFLKKKTLFFENAKTIMHIALIV